METTLRQSVHEGLVPIIPALQTKTIGWLQRKYPTVNFDNVDMIFSAGFGGSKYYRNDGGYNPKYGNPVAQISTRATLYLYDMKRLKLKKTKRQVGYSAQTECAIVHELTHHVQYEMGLPTGESLTTGNELEYLKEFYPEHYVKLVK